MGQTFCVYEGDETEPNAQNQLVMRNYNVISYVLDLLFVAKFNQHSPVGRWVVFFRGCLFLRV